MSEIDHAAAAARERKIIADRQNAAKKESGHTFRYTYRKYPCGHLQRVFEHNQSLEQPLPIAAE